MTAATLRLKIIVYTQERRRETHLVVIEKLHQVIHQ